MIEGMIESKSDLAKTPGAAYKPWRITGKPAEFAWIAAKDLKIDRRYQRHLKEARLITMARDWDWVACGAIIVALRPDGEWFVIDGQHRVEAAKRREDIQHLPCLVFEIEEIVAEAKGFLASNLGRQVMNYSERFNALVQAKDEVAMKVEGMVDGSGRVIASYIGPNTVACVKTLYIRMKRDEEVMRRIWPLAVEICVGESIPDRIVEALFWLESSLEEGVSLLDPELRKR